MDNKTIEQMLPENVLALVRKAPSNRLTRGSVRAAINLVIPEVITTTEDMEQYIVSNYDESKIVLSLQDMRRARQRRALNELNERRARLEEESLGAVEMNVRETEYGQANYSCVVTYDNRLLISPDDIRGATSKQEVLQRMREIVWERYDDDGASDWSEYDYDDHDATDHDNRDDSTDYEDFWESSKERIAASLGLTVEEMENE